jgi:hypothetical protein
MFISVIFKSEVVKSRGKSQISGCATLIPFSFKKVTTPVEIIFSVV